MATTTATRSPAPLLDSAFRPISSLGAVCILAALGLAITTQFPDPTPLVGLAVVGVLVALLWLTFSEHYEWSLVLLMLYLGLADGFLKLSTGSSSVTLIRDLLLYAIVVGALMRIAVRRESVHLPPLSGWVIAWVAVVLIQLANPGNGTLFHSLAAVRPQAAWVPLFFLAYAVMRTRTRIRRFLFLLLVIAAANGVVGLVQLNLSPQQLSSWGKGYEKAVTGEGGSAARSFVDESGELKVRPFGLGGDSGFGGLVGMLAAPAALALLALSRKGWLRLAVGLLTVGVVLAVATSQSRTAVIGAIVAVLAFAALTVTSRAGLRMVLAIGVTGFLVYLTVGILSTGTENGTFRYSSINSPGGAVSTAIDYRTVTVAKVPTYAVDYPFGAGFGSSGPASTFEGRAEPTGPLDAESEATALLIEVGIPGLVVMFGFMGTLLYLSATRIRKVPDRELRILLTAVAAPLFAIASMWWVGSSTTISPTAPYMWFVAGVLAFWLVGDRARASRGGGVGTPSFEQLVR